MRSGGKGWASGGADGRRDGRASGGAEGRRGRGRGIHGGGRVGRRLPSGEERPYARVARVNEVVREVVAESIEKLADTHEELGLLTVTAVVVDPGFAHATVLFASLSEPVREALSHVRPKLQASVAQQVRLKRTPQLSFAVDPAVSTGERVEQILRNIHETDDVQGSLDE